MSGIRPRMSLDKTPPTFHFQIFGTNLSGGVVEFRLNNILSPDISLSGVTTSNSYVVGNHVVTVRTGTWGTSNGLTLQVK